MVMRIFAITLGIAAVAGAIENARTTADYAAIHAIIDLYFEGAKTATAAPFEKAWDLEHGRMVYVKQQDGAETLQSVPIKDAIKSWTSKPAEESWGKVLSIEVTDGRMAAVMVEMLYRGNIYVDLLSLYKINGDWKIVNKQFVRREAPKTP